MKNTNIKTKNKMLLFLMMLVFPVRSYASEESNEASGDTLQWSDILKAIGDGTKSVTGTASDSITYDIENKGTIAGGVFEGGILNYGRIENGFVGFRYLDQIFGGKER